MELRNCSKCGRVFAYKGVDVCIRCLDGEEDQFKLVKEYLYDHPGATVNELSEATGVSERQILRYLRENRIEIREENNTLLDCQRCGKSIRSGRFCDSCIIAMQREFSSVISPKKVEKKPLTGTSEHRMFIAEMKKRTDHSK